MRGPRRIAAVLAVLAGVVAATVLPAASGQAADSGETFASCLAGGGTADVLLLIDDSSSLRSTDPAAARVTSARYFTNQLLRFTQRTKQPVDIAVAGFGDRYERIGDWSRLDATSRATVEASISSFRSRTSGFDTDYWTALHRSQLDLAAHAGSKTVNRCAAVVWFTDGRLDYFPRTTAAEREAYGTRKVFAPDVELTGAAAARTVRAAAQKDLCRSGGVADQLRSSGVSIFAVGLDGRGSTSGQFNLLRSIATGSADGGSCGRLGGSPPGSFTRASNIEDLLLAFDRIGTPDSAPLTQEAGICQRGAGICTDGAHRFVLDASTTRVQVLATATAAGLRARLLAPDGTLIEIPAGGDRTRTVHGASIAYSWVTAKALSIDMDEATAHGKAWTGVWQFAFVDPAAATPNGRSRTSIHILSPISPVVQRPVPELRVGATAEVRFGLSGPDGPVDPVDLLGTLEYSASLVDSAGVAHAVFSTRDKADVAGRHRLSLTGVAPGAGSLVLETRITTAATTTADGARVPGTALAAKRAAVPVAVLPPARYPSVGAAVDFGSVTGTGTASAALTTAGAGCVWIGNAGAVAVQAGPSDVRAFRVAAGAADSRSSCVVVGSAGRVPLELTAAGEGNGVLNGTVQVLAVQADRTGTPVPATVAVTASYAKPLNTTNFLLVLLAALVLGPGVPLLLFYLVKAAVSKIPFRPLVAATIPVRIDERGVRRDGTRFAVRAEDFRGTVPIGPRGERRIEAAGFELAVRLGASPFGVGRVEVDAPGRLAISDADGLRMRERATLPLAVHDHFVLLRSVGAEPSSAELLLLMAGDAGPVEQQALADRVDRAAPAMLDVLLRAEQDRGGRPAGHPAPAAAPAGAPAERATSPGTDDPWTF